MRIAFVFCAVSLGFLAACDNSGTPSSAGGSGGDFPQSADATAAATSYNTLLGTDGFTPVASYPASAHYDGVATLNGTGAQYFGILSMDATFSSNSFSGSISNFNKQATGATVAVDTTGSLNLSGTVTSSNDATHSALTGTASGTLDGQTDSLTVNGNFVGANADAVHLGLSGGTYFSGDAYGSRP